MYLLEAVLIIIGILVLSMFGIIGSIFPAIKIGLWIAYAISVAFMIYEGSQLKEEHRGHYFTVHITGHVFIAIVQLLWFRGIDRALSLGGQSGFIDFIVEIVFGGIVYLGLIWLILDLMDKFD